MNKSRNIVLLALILIGAVWASSELRIYANYSGGGIGPDVIVGDMPDIRKWGSVGSQSGFSVATTSCNIGDEPLRWISQSAFHPVISQSIYRVKDGRIEHLGQSWLKHGFLALAQSLCDTCQNPGTGSLLGVGCSDPYGASLNGSQGGLGPRSEVNAASGVFQWPPRRLTSAERGILGGRITVENSDLDPGLNTGARYFIESQYIHPDDAGDGNDNNNASYREAFVSGSGNNVDINTNGGAQTMRTEPAINAWRAVHSDVRLFNVDIPGDGRIIVGIRTTPNGNGFHNEIAIENLNSHQSVGSLSVNFGSGSAASPGFNDVDYHAEPYAATDWAPNVNGNEIEWATESFATNTDANAIRWNTLYSFWCDSDATPRQLTLGLFRPGALSEATIDLVTTVVPDTYMTTRGEYVSGGLPELAESDNMDLSLRRLGADTQSRTEFEITSTSPTSAPTDFEFTLEGSVFARTNVVQTIELYDFASDVWELVDTRDAVRAPAPDSTVTVAATGDLSRFVEAGTMIVKARVRYKSDVARQNFASNTDQTIWMISQ